MSKSAQAQPAPPNNLARLDRVVRGQLGDISWSRVRRLIETGKVRLDGEMETNPARLVAAHQVVEFHPNAQRPTTCSRLASEAIAYVDDQVVVVRKPAGVSTVPFEQGERGTLVEQVRAWLNRTAEQRGDRATGDLGVVHRLDKETSGLIVFTRTLVAKRLIANQMRHHTIERFYLAVAHGMVREATFRSHIVRNRGDGLRGSTANESIGQEATTHVDPIRTLCGATLIRCRLETGRTHQIRIHLSEAGHPLVGERVYVRNYKQPQIDANRLMLHATALGFEHPTRHEMVRFDEPPPDDFQRLVAKLEAGKDPWSTKSRSAS